MDVQVADFVTIGLLVIIEGLLSADNALVLAILVLGLPKNEQRKALRYGILGAFFFRIVAIFLAVHLMQVGFVKLIGAGYLFWLTYSHFFGREEGEDRSTIKPAVAARLAKEAVELNRTVGDPTKVGKAGRKAGNGTP